MDLLSLGKEPINADHPTGSDVRYEPEFEALQAEIDKMSNPAASGGADWEKVNKLASEILANKAKDLLAASYLAVGQIHTDQLKGFAVGLQIYGSLIEQYWDTLYPAKKRMRGRIAAIEWWLEKSEAALQTLRVEALPAERIEEFRQDLEKIDKLLQEHLEEAPLLRPIGRFIDSIPVKAEKKTELEAPSEEKPASEAAGPAAAGKSATTAEAAPRAAGAPTPPSAVEMASAGDAERVLKGALESIRRVGAYLHRENLANALAYRWRRIASWATVTELPPAPEGRTLVPPPDAGIRNVLNDMREKGNWQALVESAEQRVSEFIFWFDLNRFVAEGLSNLGGPYEDAHEALCQETAFFVHRLSGIETLAFSDGTPFADPETHQWLKSVRLGGVGTMVGPVGTGGTDDGDRIAEVMQKAQELVKKKKLPEAVSLVQQELRNSFSRKEQLLWRLGLSQILMNAKKPQLALPHLEVILQDIEEFGLEEWDPNLALKGLKMAWLGFDAHPDKEVKGRGLETLDRIAKLDPAEALRMGKG